MANQKSSLYRVRAKLSCGARISGNLAIPTSNGVELGMADVVRNLKDGILVLADVTVYEDNGQRLVSKLVVPLTGISYIESSIIEKPRLGPFAGSD